MATAATALATAPLATVELLAVDCETNARAGELCELTEVATVLVGGGECHEEWQSLVAISMPLTRGAERLTGITEAMLADAPAPGDALTALLERLEGRVLVAHNASFDVRVLRQACARAGLEWPDPPVLCTLALARRLLPLQSRRALAPLADALGIEMREAHRALADARACAEILCHLFPRLCANAPSVAEAVALASGPRRGGSRRRRRAPEQVPVRASPPDFAALPVDPGVYVFRDGRGQALYVGKSVSIRSRARAHFAPSAPDAPWRAQAEVVDYQATGSELGALVLENRLIKRLCPPGNVALRGAPDGLVYLRCRLDIAFPVLEVATEPAAGHAVNIGPLQGRRPAGELVEQLNSLFGLRHCGRRLPRRQHPSAYGQMGRCLSPCLQDLDPNLYRRRLDEALAPFEAGGDGGAALLAHIEARMRAAAAQRRYEVAGSLHRRLRRLTVLLERLGSLVGALHTRSALLLAAHPARPEHEAFRIERGRVLRFGALPGDRDELARWLAPAAAPERTRTDRHAAAEELDELRILGSWMARNDEAPLLALDAAADVDSVLAFAAAHRATTRQ